MIVIVIIIISISIIMSIIIIKRVLGRVAFLHQSSYNSAFTVSLISSQ